MTGSVIGLIAMGITGLCAAYAGWQALQQRTQYNDARLVCLLGLLALELPIARSLDGAAAITVGITGVCAVLYGVVRLRTAYVKTLRA